MKILLPGAAGRLGRALRARLRDHDVVARTKAQLDVTDLSAVRDAVSGSAPDLIINAAAFTDVDAAESAPEAAYAVNATGPRHLAIASAELGIPILHLSTDYVFDGEASRPYVESDLPAPLSVYGASKLDGEREVASLNPRHYIVRAAWLYDVDSRNFASGMAARIGESAVRVVDDQWGSPTFAPHLADAIAVLIETRAFGTYHLAGRGEATWCDLARELFAVLGAKGSIEPVRRDCFPRPAARPRYSVLASEREPRIELPPWQDGVRAFARAWRRVVP